MTLSCVLLVVLSGLFAFGCNRPGNASPPPATATAADGKPQPRLPTVKLWLGAQELVTEVARNPKEIETGMMWRTAMAENEGMLFVFAQPHQASFWMKNTLVPLSCAYIDASGVILEIHDMKPRDLRPIPAATDKVQFVLEVKQGWFQRNHVTGGAVVRTDRGSLAATFFGGR